MRLSTLSELCAIQAHPYMTETFASEVAAFAVDQLRRRPVERPFLTFYRRIRFVMQRDKRHCGDAVSAARVMADTYLRERAYARRVAA